MKEQDVNVKDRIGEGNFSVRARKTENNDTLIKRFLKKTKKERIIEEVFERSHFKKPSIIKREEKLRKKLLIEKNKKLLEMDKEE